MAWVMLLVLVIVQGTEAISDDVKAALEPGEAILATCSANSNQKPLEMEWKLLSSLGNTTRNFTIPPENGTAPFTSYLIGAVPQDGQKRVVQCVIRRPDLPGEKVISYLLHTSSEATDEASGQLVEVCTLEPASQSPVYQVTNGQDLTGEATALANILLQFMNGTYGQLGTGGFVTLTFLSVVGGIAILTLLFQFFIDMKKKGKD
ncbi:uncharacterized protein LOC134440126 [Engraulis encrasicolus]|uniref:uncharacterized protein LOC134440126 n=1 Tax=Engraulis encrasicolus TaxID=184585 RepID=UPI002FD51AD7